MHIFNFLQREKPIEMSDNIFQITEDDTGYDYIKRDRILANIIIQREYDIDDWVYENISVNTLRELVHLEVDRGFNCITPSNPLNLETSPVITYIKSQNISSFYKRVKKVFKETSNSELCDFIETLIQYGCLEIGLMVFDKYIWKIVDKIYRDIIHRQTLYKYTFKGIQVCDERYHMKMVRLMLIAASIPAYEYQLRYFVKRFPTKYYNILEDMIEYMSYVSHTPNELGKMYLAKCAAYLGLDKKYEDTKNCWEVGIPVFYKKNWDQSDFLVYLGIIRDIKVPILLDEKFEEVLTKDLLPSIDFRNIDKLPEKESIVAKSLKTTMETIVSKINQNNLHLLKYFGNYTVTDIRFLLYADNKSLIGTEYTLKDFSKIVKLCGENRYGYPIDIQLSFLESGGDVRSMMREFNSILPESTILNNKQYLIDLLRILSIEDIRYLIYNCMDFVLNIITFAIHIPNNYVVKLAKALYEFPVNKDVWDAIRAQSSSVKLLEYRRSLSDIICKCFLDIGTLFKTVPEAMAYLPITDLYVTLNFNMDNIKYIPIKHYARNIKFILSKPYYIRLNYFSEGEEVSLMDIVDDADFLLSIIKNGKNYAYICDLKVSNPIKIVNLISR